MVRLTNNNADANDTALDLRVQAGEAPMSVNRDTLVPNLNADRLDGKHATEIGVNGLERVVSSSGVSNSDSFKSALATCPSGKVVVGTGFNINGGKTGPYPNELTNVVIDEVIPSLTAVSVTAYEEEATSASWHVTAYAICATAP